MGEGGEGAREGMGERGSTNDLCTYLGGFYKRLGPTVKVRGVEGS